jgi:hypothetical protein
LRLTRARLNEYLARLAKKTWTIGADLRSGQPTLARDPRRGLIELALTAVLPGAGVLRPAELTIRERWALAGDGWERVGYLYELDDHEMNRRRAYHWHDPEVFTRRFQVVVHEHCEEIMGIAACRHYAGFPVENGHVGIDLLLAAWALAPGESLGCDRLVCLEGPP